MKSKETHTSALPSLLSLGFFLSAVLIPVSGMADVLYTEDWEDAPTGDFGFDSVPGWEGMLANNSNDQPVSDWQIVEGGGLDWVGSAGATLDGGNKYFTQNSRNNSTGRAFWLFADGDINNALPTDIGAPTSIYVRMVYEFPSLTDPFTTSEEGPFWIFRFNSSWSFLLSVKSKGTGYLPAGSTELKHFLELRRDVDGPDSPQQTVVLPDAVANQPYLVVARYDFNDLGVVVGAAAWINPTVDEMDTPHLETSLRAGDQYDTFVNPLITVDLTAYRGDTHWDNLMIATSWDDVVPQSGATTWSGYAVVAGWADTGSWLGMVYVDHAPWIWSAELNNWIYIDESSVSASGGWAYVVN